MEMSCAQKNRLFENVNAFRGFLFSEAKGIERSFNDLYFLENGYLPEYVRPHINTLQRTVHSFTKVTHALKKMNIETADISVNASFASAESEYKHEQSSSVSQSEVKEYLLAQFIIRKATFNVDTSAIHPTDKFIRSIMDAIDSQEDDLTNARALVNVLNKWGYYFPVTFTLGGSLYSETETLISEYEAAETERKDFSVSFKAAFDSIGGGGAYSGAWETETSESTSTKYDNTVIYQIGGTEGLNNDYSRWVLSLYEAKTWDIVECSDLYPSILLLNNLTEEQQQYASGLFMRCLQLLNTISVTPAILKMQSFLDLNEYNLAIQEMLDPF